MGCVGTKPAESGESEYGQIETAAARLAQEARQVLSYGSRGVNDVTEEFKAAASGINARFSILTHDADAFNAELQPGQLVKDEFFTLFESVGALEVQNYHDRQTVLQC